MKGYKAGIKFMTSNFNEMIDKFKELVNSDKWNRLVVHWSKTKNAYRIYAYIPANYELTTSDGELTKKLIDIQTETVNQLEDLKRRLKNTGLI